MSKRRVHFIGLIAVAILFVGTIFVRSNEFERDMGGRHEWITAHSLITMEIWREHGGPSAFGFNPVYSYPDCINFPRPAMGGVTDENGLHYYTSYPPFAFIFGYYATQIMGGPSVKTIRILNYVIHLSCAILLFLIFYELGFNKKRFNFAGLAIAGMYLYSTGFLYGHGLLFFCDMLEQILVIGIIYLVVRFAKNRIKNLKLYYIGLFALFFLATYTEWLGLFFSFFAGLGFLLIFFIKKEKRFLMSFLIIGIASSLALGTTIMQYSSIAGWDELKEISTQKYNIRSGRVVNDPKLQLHIENSETHNLLERGLAENYKTLQNLIGAFGILFIPFVILRKFRNRMKGWRVPMGIILLLLLSVLTHYYVFFNFNALHAFSGMKTGLLISFVVAVLIMLIIQSMPDFKFRMIAGIVITGFLIFKLPGEFKRYEKYSNHTYMNLASPARTIGEYQDPNVAIFANAPFHPINLYYSKRDWFRAMDTSTVSVFMTYFEVEEADYFILDGDKVKERQRYQKYDDEFKLIDQEWINN